MTLLLQQQANAVPLLMQLLVVPLLITQHAVPLLLAVRFVVLLIFMFGLKGLCYDLPSMRLSPRKPQRYRSIPYNPFSETGPHPLRRYGPAAVGNYNAVSAYSAA